MVEKRGFKKRKQLGSGTSTRHKDIDAALVLDADSTDIHSNPESKAVQPLDNSDDTVQSKASTAIDDDVGLVARSIKKRKPNSPVADPGSGPGPEMLAMTNTNGPKNIRTTTITDFQPDVCKDFLQTGYCGYGDTCKFIHVRNESTQKKPVVRDWEISTDDPKKDDSVAPFKCAVCKKDYDQPVETKCDHVFCKKCFMDRYKKGKTRCYICHEETNGIIAPYKEKHTEKT